MTIRINGRGPDHVSIELRATALLEGMCRESRSIEELLSQFHETFSKEPWSVTKVELTFSEHSEVAKTARLVFVGFKTMGFDIKVNLHDMIFPLQPKAAAATPPA